MSLIWDTRNRNSTTQQSTYYTSHYIFVSGGNIMHLLDSFRNNFKCVPVIHEVAAGIAAEYFFQNTTVPTEARLFIITGFLGGLTTFSTFSVETVTLLLREQYSWAFAIVSSHLFGSLVMTVLGMLTIKFFMQN